METNKQLEIRRGKINIEKIKIASMEAELKIAELESEILRKKEAMLKYVDAIEIEKKKIAKLEG